VPDDDEAKEGKEGWGYAGEGVGERSIESEETLSPDELGEPEDEGVDPPS